MRRKNLWCQVPESEMQTSGGNVIWLEDNEKDWPQKTGYKGRPQLIC